ncbi:MAG TPA: LexA family transcriptional regulator [Chloroflexota bacterium]|nr:LexA family transcriptional regulator [Chloroflexota bacterium]
MDVDKARVRLGQLRTHRGWSARELSRRAGVSVSWITDFERGEMRNPQGRTLGSVASALGWADWDTMMSTDALEPPTVQPVPVSGELRATIREVLREEAASFRQGLDHQESVLTTPDAYRIQPSEAMRLIPQAPGVTAGVGAGGGLDDVEIYMHPNEIEGRDLAWARVKGECMVPWLEEGDILIFERISERDIQDRDYLVLVLLDEGAEGAHVVKRVRWGGKNEAVLEARDGTKRKVDMRRVKLLGRYVERRGRGI